jgi:hypothetical protein
MILKSLSRKSDSTGQLVNYVMRYIFKEQEDPSIKTEFTKSKQHNSKFIIRHNLRARTSLKNFIKEFQENESFRLVKRKDSVRLYHTIISFSNKDKEYVSDEMLKDIAKKFIELRGPGNLYLGTKHEEQVDHIHMHFIISGVSTNGRSSRVSRQKFHSIKAALQKYQQEKYPEMVHSLPEHGKSKRINKEVLIEHIKANRQTDKQTILERLEKMYTNSKSQKHFLEQLNIAGHPVYLRNGRVQGITFNEKKFRFSRLGFDDTRLQALDQPQPIQDNALQALQQLRKNKLREAKREINTSVQEKESVAANDKTKTLLDELSDIRNGRDRQEQTKDYNDKGFERSFDEERREGGDTNHDGMEEGIAPVFGGRRHLNNPIALEIE